MEKAHELSKEKRTVDISTDEDITFQDMLLSPQTLKGLQAAGFVKPSPIQLKAIPYGRCGFDLIVQAKSGTGKTCVFSVIAMEMLMPSVHKLQVIVLAPTREISVQISNVISSIARCVGDIKVESFIGGLPFEEDKKKLAGCQIAVGAPGRMKHLISHDLMDLTAVRLFVLDEADRLMEGSFYADISYIFSKLPLSKQIIAASATFPEELEKFVAEFMNKPIRVSPSQDPILLGVRQFAFSIEASPSCYTQMRNKVAALLEILSRITFKQCLVFCNYQSWAENICKEIIKQGWPATFIHGSQKQSQRLKAFETLKQNRCRVFFSTDLTSRGIDVENVNLVVNLDLPYDCATYLHRVGRAGRYGTYGKAVTIVQEGEEVEIFRKLLYNVGGSHFHIYQFPKENDDLLNVWEANDEQFEKLSGLLGEYKFDRKKLTDQVPKHNQDEENMKKERATDIINKYRLQPPETDELPTWESLASNLASFRIDELDNAPVVEDAANEASKPVAESVDVPVVEDTANGAIQPVPESDSISVEDAASGALKPEPEFDTVSVVEGAANGALKPEPESDSISVEDAANGALKPEPESDSISVEDAANEALKPEPESDSVSVIEDAASGALKPEPESDSISVKDAANEALKPEPEFDTVSVVEGAANLALKPVPESVITSILCLENEGWNSFYEEFKSFKEGYSTETEEGASGGYEDVKDIPPGDEMNYLSSSPDEDQDPDYSDGNLASFEIYDAADSSDYDLSSVNLEINPDYEQIMQNWFTLWFNQSRAVRDYVQYYQFWRNNM